MFRFGSEPDREALVNRSAVEQASGLGVWHPWYVDKRHLVEEWLESDDPEPLRLAVPPGLRFEEHDPGSPIVPSEPLVVELRKQRVYSGAPLTEPPSVRLQHGGLVWHVATEQYGRTVSGRPRQAGFPNVWARG